MAPSCDEGLLHNVGGIAGIDEHPAGVAEQRGAVAVDHDFERFPVAESGRADKEAVAGLGQAHLVRPVSDHALSLADTRGGWWS